MEKTVPNVHYNVLKLKVTSSNDQYKTQTYQFTVTADKEDRGRQYWNFALKNGFHSTYKEISKITFQISNSDGVSTLSTLHIGDLVVCLLWGV